MSIPVGTVPEVNKCMRERCVVGGGGVWGHSESDYVRTAQLARRVTNLELGEKGGGDIKIEGGVVGGRFAQKVTSRTIATIKRACRSQAFEFGDGEDGSGLIQNISIGISDSSPEVKEFFGVRENKEFARFPDCTDCGGFGEGEINGGGGIVKLLSDTCLGMLKFLLFDGLK